MDSVSDLRDYRLRYLGIRESHTNALNAIFFMNCLVCDVKTTKPIAVILRA